MQGTPLRAIHRRTGIVLGERIDAALSMGARMRGLLGRARLETGEGLWIEPCSSIHTIFMPYPIDAVFVDDSGTVTRVYSHLRPWRVAFGGWRARGVLELPAGITHTAGIRAGDSVLLERN